MGIFLPLIDNYWRNQQRVHAPNIKLIRAPLSDERPEINQQIKCYETNRIEQMFAQLVLSDAQGSSY